MNKEKDLNNESITLDTKDKNENYDECSETGALIGLIAKGHQDKYCDLCGDNNIIWDIRKKFLRNIHQVVYKKLKFLKNSDASYKTPYFDFENNKTIVKIHKFVEFTIEKTCDLINNVDLVLINPTNNKNKNKNVNININDIIESIETTYGDQRIDQLNSGDLYTQIETNCAIFKRKISYINGKIFIPLVMAPFYNNNLVFPSTQHMLLKINIKFKENYDHSEVSIYANNYYLDTLDRRILYTDPHEFITIQNQGAYEHSKYKMKKGINIFRLNFNHPVYQIYFWGFDKTKVKNIKLELNKANFYNGPIEPLEHHKLELGLDVEPVMIFFSQNKIDECLKSSINFSRIDYANLIIETEEEIEEEEKEIYIIGLNMQPIRCSNMMYGLAYSK